MTYLREPRGAAMGADLREPRGAITRFGVGSDLREPRGAVTRFAVGTDLREPRGAVTRYGRTSLGAWVGAPGVLTEAPSGTDGTCRSSFVYDPDIEAFGVKGRCVPAAQSTSKFTSRKQYEDSKSPSGVASFADAFFKSLTGSIGTSTMTPPGAPAPYPYPAPGMSTGTKVAIAGGALVLIAIVASRR